MSWHNTQRVRAGNNSLDAAPLRKRSAPLESTLAILSRQKGRMSVMIDAWHCQLNGNIYYQTELSCGTLS